MKENEILPMDFDPRDIEINNNDLENTISEGDEFLYDIVKSLLERREYIFNNEKDYFPGVDIDILTLIDIEQDLSELNCKKKCLEIQRNIMSKRVDNKFNKG